MIESDVIFWINDKPEQRGTAISNGDYYSFFFGIKYPISKFWNNKVKPIRSVVRMCLLIGTNIKAEAEEL